MKKSKPRKSTSVSRRPSLRSAAPAKPSTTFGELAFTLDVRKDGLEPILGAAYLLTDRAYARLGGDKTKSLRVLLTPKRSRDAQALDALKADFLAELDSQRLRWAVARQNQPVREYVAEHALSLAAEFAARAAAPAPAAEPAPDQLTAEQKSEIERLIAEVEAEIQEMNKDQKHPDPKGVSLSWEAAADKEKEKGRPAA